jgi:hypothetical protein
MIKKIFPLLACFIFMTISVGCGSPIAAQTSEPDPNKIKPYPSGTAPTDVYVATQESVISMRVLWTVSGYIVSKGATWSEQDAKALLFKPLDINDTEIIFDSQVCKNVNFQQETLKAAGYLSTVWQATPKTLGIEDQEIQVFKTNCTLPGFQEYMRLGDGRLIVPINGVFFFFDPAVTR